MSTLNLNVFGITVHLRSGEDGEVGGEITSDLERATCPCCGLEDCCYDCDESGEGGDLLRTD